MFMCFVFSQKRISQKLKDSTQNKKRWRHSRLAPHFRGPDRRPTPAAWWPHLPPTRHALPWLSWHPVRLHPWSDGRGPTGPAAAVSTLHSARLNQWKLKVGLVKGGVDLVFCVFVFAIWVGRLGPRLCQNVTQKTSF